jgi:hypothetical protein
MLSCGASNKKKFVSEINIHFRDPENQSDRNVFVFPEVLVCIGCGFAQFTVPDSELCLLKEITVRRNGDPTIRY